MSYEFAPAGYSLASAIAAAKARRARMDGNVPDEGIHSHAELRRRREAAYLARRAEQAKRRAEERIARQLSLIQVHAAAKQNILAVCPAHFIREIVCQHFGISVTVMTSRCRRKFIARARQTGMYFAREFTPLSFSQIGKMFGGVDHTVAIYGCWKIGELRKADTAFAAKLALIEAEIKAKLVILGDAES